MDKITLNKFEEAARIMCGVAAQLHTLSGGCSQTGLDKMADKIGRAAEGIDVATDLIRTATGEAVMRVAVACTHASANHPGALRVRLR